MKTNAKIEVRVNELIERVEKLENRVTAFERVIDLAKKAFTRKPTLEELEQLLNAETETEVEILDNGEIRAVGTIVQTYETRAEGDFWKWTEVDGRGGRP